MLLIDWRPTVDRLATGVWAIHGARLPRGTRQSELVGSPKKSLGEWAMSTEMPIDVQALLAPLDESIDRSNLESDFFRVKDAFDEAQALLKEVEDKERMGGLDATGQPWRVIPPPDWERAIELSIDYLGKSRDMRVAAWLTGAILGSHQLAGLEAGLDLCLGFCETYWSEIEPPPDDDSGHFDAMGGVRTVLSRRSFASLWDTTLVSSGSDRQSVGYTYLDYRRSMELQRITGEELEEKLEEGYVSQEQFREVLLATSPEFLQNNLALVDSCIQKVARLSAFLKENCLPEASDEPTEPDTREFREELQNIRTVMQQLASSVTGDAEEGLGEASAGNAASTGAAENSKGRMTRESALKSIEDIARFFEQTEPHSPLYFALRQVVRWGRMPFDKLMIELIDDRSVIENLRRQIGLPQNEEE
jgi:type VI secretion system protein ImpA